MINEKERMLAIAWTLGFALLCALLTAGLLLVAWPAEQFAARGFSAAAWNDARAYFASLAAGGPKPWFSFLKFVLFDAPADFEGAAFVRRLQPVLGRGWRPEEIARLAAPVAGMSLPGPGACASLLLGFSAFVAALAKCPYEMRRKSQGSSRWATDRDLARWGLFNNTGLILGERRVFSPLRLRFVQRAIRGWEPLSVADLAPPGTGKTVQLVANLLADWDDTRQIPAPSFVVNDPKGELYETTSAWRSQLGPVFKLNWGATRDAESDSWNPLSPASIARGEDARRLRDELAGELKAIYGTDGRASDALGALQLAIQSSGGWRETVTADPTFAAIIGGKGVESALGAETMRAEFDSRRKRIFELIEELSECYTLREQVIDAMVAVLVPDTVEEHWRNTGRAAGAGFILFHMAQCDRLGREPSIGGLLEWMSGISKAAPDADVNAVAAEQGKPGQGKQNDDDDVAKLLIGAIDEAKTNGYPPRVIQELSQLKMKPDKERGSVVSTFDASIAVFKQASVRKRTSTSSFRLVDVRGQGTHDGVSGRALRKGEMPPPITIYVCIALNQVESFGRVTGLLFEQLAGFLLSQKPEEIKKSRPVYIMADEFWTLPPLPSLLKIPAFGRGQRVALNLIGQAWAQIGLAFGPKGSDMIKAMQGAVSSWVIKTQTQLDEAKMISDMIGNATHIKKSYSRESGMKISFSGGQGASIGGGNVSTDLIGLPLMRPDELMSMAKLEVVDGKIRERGGQLILMSGRRNTPVMCSPYIWFDDPRMRARVGNKLPFCARDRWFGRATPEGPMPSAQPAKPDAGAAALLGKFDAGAAKPGKAA